MDWDDTDLDDGLTDADLLVLEDNGRVKGGHHPADGDMP